VVRSVIRKLYSSPDIVRLINRRWAEHVARIRKITNVNRISFRSENLQGRDHVTDLGVRVCVCVEDNKIDLRENRLNWIQVTHDVNCCVPWS
jgi:hypothetical protein